ncbi:MAG: NAD-dependent epimerase/dehydratase family protein [Actinomycetota bacterium]|nr:NAD-dependent epimerase/dehydratase family protein [Actinomycetota bacterium]
MLDTMLRQTRTDKKTNKVVNYAYDVINRLTKADDRATTAVELPVASAVPAGFPVMAPSTAAPRIIVLLSGYRGDVRLLILGGTLFLGRHLVEAALDRGDEVMLFNRGETNADLYPELEHVRGDRDGDLSALAGREWDAVVDTSARLPRWVRTAAEALSDAIAHYTFVSSGSVYADTRAAGVDESAPVHTIADETTEEITSPESYGALKALCERAAEELVPGRVLSVRAGLIVGPYDPTGRFTYWPHRIARGGDVLAPEPRDQPVQFVHGRDLADWILSMAERRVTGVFNAVGPEQPLTLASVLDECRRVTRSDAELVWADERFLVDEGIEPWSELPLWLAPNVNPAYAGFLAIDGSQAIAAGLRFRPLAQTISDTLADAEPTGDAGLSPGREADLLAKLRGRAAAAGERHAFSSSSSTARRKRTRAARASQ